MKKFLWCLAVVAVVYGQDSDKEVVGLKASRYCMSEGDLRVGSERDFDLVKQARMMCEIQELRCKEAQLREENGRLRKDLHHNIYNLLCLSVMATDVAGDEEGITEETREMLRMAGIHGEHVLHVLDDICGQSHDSEFELPQVLEAMKVFTSYYSEQGVDANTQVGDEISKELEKNPVWQADKGKYIRVVSNLIANATRCTKKGSITVAVEKDQRPGYIITKVRDTGCGIAPELLSNLFDRGSQDDGRSRGRFGIGLSNCRDIVREVGGDLSVTSEVGKGTEFSFSFPVEVPSSTETMEY